MLTDHLFSPLGYLWNQGFRGTLVFLSLLVSIVLHRVLVYPNRTEMDSKKKTDHLIL